MERLFSFNGTTYLAGSLLLLAGGCREADSLFSQLQARQTGIHFTNTITPTDSLNILTYNYLYNGAGVGIGDFDRDGRQDLFFAGNQVSSRLYLNRTPPGNTAIQFDDISRAAGIQTDRWCTGVSVADVNADGWPDVYVSVANPPNTPLRSNLLFINQGLANGNPVFREMALAYGLEDSRFCSQAAFFDYDRDGDLDCYLLHNFPEKSTQNNLRQKRTDGSHPSTDRLLRNEGINTKLGHPVFTDVSGSAGITVEGYGLGLAISDLNQDGWPDVYCANDFISNDLLWINKANGRFSNDIGRFVRHQSYNSMGVDAADYNNDAYPDLLVLDMLPESSPRQKLMLSAQNLDKHALATSRAYGYQPQFVRNMLQQNNGPGPEGEPSFSEVGQLAGISKTDWSWSCLFADYDNDGWKDLTITNGYRKDVTDRDFVAFSDEFMLFGAAATLPRKRKELLAKIPEINVPKYGYRNRGDGTFDDVSALWGVADSAFANGAAYADLDNDGDLDWIVCTLDGPTLLYQNLARQQKNPANYIAISLEGEGQNPAGIGSKVWVWTSGKVQYLEAFPVRGYLSSVSGILHVGLGQRPRPDSLRVTWPDGRTQLWRQPPGNTRLTLRQKTARYVVPAPPPQPDCLLHEIASPLDRAFRHREQPFTDFDEQPLLPHNYSQNGFGLAVGDINGDGLDDVFAGNALGSKGQFFTQQANGRFQVRPLGADSLHEDMGVLLFDADRDGDNDLYVVGGGSELPEGHPAYRDRLFLNDGHGQFAQSGALPPATASGSCVVAADYDHDGDLDLFVGGRTVVGRYPLPGQSRLLRNDTPKEGNVPGTARFTDVTPKTVRGIGLVCAALWTDVDNDTWPDLLLAGEWMPLTLLRNNRGRLTPPTDTVAKSAGWFNSLVGGDFDNDGDTDYIAGNLGLNSPHKASVSEPLQLFVADFDKNGRLDPVMVGYYLGKAYPTHPRDALLSQIPSLRRRVNRYSDYANASFGTLFPTAEFADIKKLSVSELRSVYLENRQGRLVACPLPMAAQTAPIFGLLTDDFNADGNLDVLLTGNSAAPEAIFGPYDAFNGLLLAGNGKGSFKPVSARESGFYVPADSKGLAQVRLANGTSLVLSAINNEGIRWFSRRSSTRQFIARPTDACLLLNVPGNRVQKHEFYYGQGYLSSTTRTLTLLPGASGRIVSVSGQSRPLP